MSTKSLQEKKVDIETTFESLKAEQKTHSDKVTEIEAELLRLQGQYRLIDELITAEKINTPKEVKDK